MPDNFPKLETSSHEVYESPKKTNINNTTTRYIIVKLLKNQKIKKTYSQQWIDHPDRINKETADLNTTDQMNMININRTFYPTTV